MQEPAIAVEPPLVPMHSQPGPLTMRSVFAATLAVAVYVGFITPRHRFHGGYGETKVDIARLVTLKYANERYPLWAREHRGRECPMSLRELDPYMDKADARDPWGRDYMFTCADGRLYVMSLGADGVSGTADDIWSHQ